VFGAPEHPLKFGASFTPHHAGACICAVAGKANKAMKLINVEVAVAALILIVTGPGPALAQAPDAEERCTPDVMRLCSEFQHDRDHIVKCAAYISVQTIAAEMITAAASASQPPTENPSKSHP
jgi:hypothetical protein